MADREPWIRIAMMIAAVYLAGTIPAFCADLSQEEAVRLNTRGQKLLAQGNFEEARIIYQQMLNACGASPCRAVALMNIGRAHLESGQHEQAMEALEQADKAFAEIPDVEAPYWRGIVSCLKGRALCEANLYHKSLEDFEKAERYLREAVKSAAPSRRSHWKRELAFVHGNRALVFTHLYDYPRAKHELAEARRLLKDLKSDALTEADKYEGLILLQMQDYPRAIRVCERLVGYFQKKGYEREKATQLLNLGHIHEQLSEYSRAQKEYEEALDLSRRVNDRSLEANIIDHLGTLNYRRGNYLAARNDHLAALATRKELGQHRYSALTLINLAQLDRATADYRLAVKRFREAHGIGVERGYKDVQGLALEGLGLVLKDLGQFREAGQYLRSSLTSFRNIKDQRLEAIALRRLGNLHEQFGTFDAAHDRYAQAAAIMEAIGDRLFFSEVLSEMAMILIRDGRVADAENRLDRALIVRREIGAPLGDLLCQRALFLVEKPRYAESLDRQKELTEALHYIELAEKAISPEDLSGLMLMSYAHGRCLLETAPDASVRTFDTLLSRAKSTGSLRFSFLANVGLGLAYERLAQFSQAETAYENAVNQAEMIRATLDERTRATFLNGEEILGVKHVLPYEGLARIRLRKGDAQRAFEATERTRARAFADTMESSLTNTIIKSGDNRVLQWQASTTRLKTNREQLEKCLSGQGDRSLIPELHKERLQLQEIVQRLEEQIRQSHPRYSDALLGQYRGIHFSSLKEGEFLLSYEVTDSETLVFLCDVTGIVKVASIAITREQLNKLLDQYTNPLHVVREQEDLLKFNDSSLAAGKRLFDLLVTPVLSNLPQDRTLIIVPDDCLASVPFELLLVTPKVSAGGERGRLIEDRSDFFMHRNYIAYSQSLTALTLARARSMRGTTETPRLLVMGAPAVQCTSGAGSDVSDQDIGELELGLKIVAPDGPLQKSPQFKILSPEACNFMKDELQPLTESKTLANDLKSMFGGQSEVYLENDATLTNFRDKIAPNIREFDKLLFATHGIQGSTLDEVTEPALLLSMSSPGTDSWLRMSEVLGLEMNAELVYLLACQSGRGVQLAGEGILSLGRAFQMAGAKSVVVSLWQVDESASVELARLFFQGLTRGLDKTRALRSAKLALRKIQNGKFDHPFFWSAFVLIGDP